MIEVLQTREELYEKYLPKYGVGAELGVLAGENSIELLRITQSSKIYLCDPNIELASATTQLYPELEVIKQCDEDWLPTLPYKSLDWVYIDSLHTYKQTILEFHLLKNKVTKIIAGHDMCCSAVHNTNADDWGAGVLRALLEILPEGWLEVVAITVGSGVSNNAYPSWACKVKS